MKKTILVILILLFAIIILTGCSNKKGTSTSADNGKVQNEYKSKNENEILQNIEIRDFILEDETLLAILKNNNNFDVKALWIEVVFYDEDNKVVGTSKTGFKVLKSNIEAAINDFDMPSRFSTYKITLSLGEENKYESCTDKIKINSNNTGEKIVVITENESNKELDLLNVSVVYFKNGLPVGYSWQEEYDIEKGKTTYFNIQYSYNKHFDKVEFDEYKVFVNSAYAK